MEFRTLEEMGVEPERLQITKVEARDLAEQLYDELLVDYFRSIQGWNLIGGQGVQPTDHLDDDRHNRERFILRSRLLARREPLSKQAIRLYTTYSGLLKAEFKSENDQAVKVFKQKFWNLKANRRLLKPRYRRRLSNNLLTDGELFFVLFPGGDGEVRIRTVDPTQIPTGNIITHPEDREVPLYYKRNVPQTTTNTDSIRGATGTRVAYYRDWELDDELLEEALQNDGFRKFHEDIQDKIARVNGEEVRMFHLPFDAHGLRGNGLLFAVLSYAENWRNFLQDRATIVRGLSTYIRTITLKGGSKAVNDVASRLKSAFAIGASIETNPPDTAGSNWIQNQQLQKQETPPITNAGDAMNDSRIFRQPVASGVGITEANLTGDPSIGNLASQSQMDGPQLQNFLDYQQLWEEAIKDLWIYVLELNGMGSEDEDALDVSFPAIVSPPLADLTAALTFGLQSQLVPKQEAARSLMMALGIEDIDKQLKALEKEPPPPTPTGQPGQNGNQPPQPKPQPTLPSEMKEHGTKIAGICPSCGEEGGLIEAHGMNHCTKCVVTYVPESQQRIGNMMEQMQLALTKVMGEDTALEIMGNGKNGKH